MKTESETEIVEENAMIEIPQQKIQAPAVVSANPYDKLIELALTSDASMEKLEKFLELKERHDQNEAKKSYFLAMAEFKKNSVKIIKDKKGHNSSYATLANILDVVTPSLGSFGLSLSWDLEQNAKDTKVTAVLTHANGYSKRTSLTFGLDTSGNKSDIHGLGSTISYLERYTAKAILGIAEKDQDNDAQGVGAPEPSSLVKLTPEWKALQETIKIFPEKYDAAVIHFGGVPVTASTCNEVDNWIKSEVDKKDD